MRSLLLVLLLVFGSVSVQAADLFVNADGTGDYPTIQAAIDAANNGDSVLLAPGAYTGTGNRDIEVDFPVTIASSNPDYPAAINCQGSAAEPHRGFIIYADAPILQNLIIHNGYATNGGAVMVDGGSPELRDCVFLNNTAIGFGGAVGGDGADQLLADHCVFGGNSAGTEGGAIYGGSGMVTRVYNCTLVRNQAPSGAAIFYTDSEIRLNSSIVAYNRGGVGVDDYYGAGYVIGCTDIFGNEGGDWTGSLASQLGINNNVRVDPVLCDPMGILPNFALMDSSPVGDGFPCGALGALGIDADWPAPIYGVTAEGDGMYPTIQAAVDNIPRTATIKLSSGTYTGPGNRNVVLDTTGVDIIGQVGDPSLVVLDAEGSAENPGRIINATGYFAGLNKLRYLTFRGGYADGAIGGSGGAIMANSMAQIDVVHCIFENNYAADGGADIGGSHASTVWVSGCQFTPSAGQTAIKVLYQFNNTRVFSSTFAGPGGGLSILGASSWSHLWVENCQFNSTGGVGLTLENVSTGDPGHDVIGCFFTVQPGQLAARIENFDQVNFVDCVFSGISGDEAAQAVDALDSHLEFLNCDFGNFLSPLNPGTVHTAGGILGLDGCSFTGSSSCLNLVDATDFTVNNSIFNDNSGATAVTLTNSTGQFNDSTFTGNSTPGAGGAVAQITSNTTYTGCLFQQNIATGDGGAIHVNDGTATLINCDLDANTSGAFGGSVYSFFGVMDFNSCNLTGNTAAGHGGGAFHTNGNVTYTLGQVSGNNASTGGGVVTSNGSSSLTGVEISQNSAVYGGGFAGQGNDTQITDCSFSGNSANNYAGINQHSGGSLTVTGTTITGNTALSNGSGVGVDHGVAVSFQGTTISGNSSGTNAAQISCFENSLVMENSIIAFSGSGPAASLSGDGYSISLQNCDVFGNAGGDWTGPLAGQDGTACNFSLDPQFCDAAAGDYHVAASSPCLPANNACSADVGAMGQGCSGASPVSEPQDLPRSFAVLGNAPNPFNPQTEISFKLPGGGPVTVEIYDVTGRRVRQLLRGERYTAGSHRVTWDGRDDQGQAQSSGVYLYRVTAEGRTLGGKMAMIR